MKKVKFFPLIMLQVFLAGLGASSSANAQDSLVQSLFRNPTAEQPACVQRNGCGEGNGAAPFGTVFLVENDSGSDVVIHLGFLQNSRYQPSDLAKFCKVSSTNKHVCSFRLENDSSFEFGFFDGTRLASFAVAVNQDPWQGCGNTYAEFTLHNYQPSDNTWQDSFDISLVNGFSFPMRIRPGFGPTVSVKSPTGNQSNNGVYPLGCTTCVGREGAECPGDVSECKRSQDSCRGGSPCQIMQKSGNAYEIDILNPEPL
jgi:Thaumatin family